MESKKRARLLFLEWLEDHLPSYRQGNMDIHEIMFLAQKNLDAFLDSTQQHYETQLEGGYLTESHEE